MIVVLLGPDPNAAYAIGYRRASRALARFPRAELLQLRTSWRFQLTQYPEGHPLHAAIRGGIDYLSHRLES